MVCFCPFTIGFTTFFFSSVGILEHLWKVVEAIINTCIGTNVLFHDILHGFRPHKGTGTAIIDAKLLQELSQIQHTVLYQIFLALKKAYDTIHRGCALQQLKAYGVCPRLLHLIHANWQHQIMVTQQSGFHGPTIQPQSGNTQGGLLSPQIFNIQIDAVVRHWFHLLTNNNGITQHRIGHHAAELLPLFYADDGHLGTIDLTLLEGSLNTLLTLFQRIGLETNLIKTVLMIGQPNRPHF
jgi:Reverse transcriptase (RNA-dependent DNA polymerase)